MKPLTFSSISAHAALCLTLALPLSAFAAPTTYSYVGNAFTQVDSATLGSHITASVTFKSDFNALGEVKASTEILSWTIATDTMTFSSATGGVLDTGSVFNFQNGVGIREWYLSVTRTGTLMSTGRSATSSNDVALNSLYINRNQYQPGIWTLGGGAAAAPVPEPASLLLMGAGVAGLLLHRRRAAA